MPTITGALRRVVRALRFGRFDRAGAFKHIFDSRYWGDGESVSGIGSRLDQTENLRAALPDLVKRYDVKTLFDAPCGDLNWMKTVLPTLGVHYIGGDIVPEVVDIARANSPDPSFEFRVFDIVSDPFPDADMWLCRDVLFHLSYANIDKVFANFCRSNVRWMLVTTHTAPTVVNRNIVTGDFRHLDLFKPPFSLPRSLVVERLADYADPAPPRDVVLIERTALAAYLSKRG